ncbi:MAG TPA: hypothetical protein VEW64_01775 [Methyloceanibacter sp.]|jgi:hypothetical protein|nr:hypothetical protein [Methyloceanibacter sp.]
MDHKSGTIRAMLAGTTAALCLASTLFVGACAVKTQSFDFPAMRLTSPPADDAQSPQQPL